MKSVVRILVVILLLAAALGWTRLRFDADVLNTLPDEVPAVRGLKLHQRHFAGADELIIRLRMDNETAAAEIAQSLALALRRETSLVDAVWWQPPWQENPLSLAELVAEAWLNQPPAKFAELHRLLESTNAAARLATARERLTTTFSPGELARLSYDPLGLTEILTGAAGALPDEEKAAAMFQSLDGCSRFLWVKARPQLTDYRECETWLKAVKTVVDRWETLRRLRSVSGQFKDRVNARRPDLSDQEKRDLSNSLASHTMWLKTGPQIAYSGRPAFMAEIGGGMERDMAAPSLGTLAIIVLLFYLVHRCLVPLLWLVLLLILIFTATLGLGGLALDSINVVSLGFAAILLGLAEDFAIVMLQEARAHAHLDFAAVQRRARAGIYWSALTTAAAFLLLNFSGLPGLGQLGTLVAIGIGLAALVMVHFYLPPIWKRLPRDKAPPSPPAGDSAPAKYGNTGAIASLILVVLAAGGLTIAGLPSFDTSTNALRPKQSEAYAVLDELKANTGGSPEPLLLLIEDTSPQNLLAAGHECRKEITRLIEAGMLAEGQLPLELVRQPQNHAANLQSWSERKASEPSLNQVAASQGFGPDALKLAIQLIGRLNQQAAAPSAIANSSGAAWLLARCHVRGGGRFHLLGTVQPAVPARQVAAAWQMPDRWGASVYLTNWDLVGVSMAAMVQQELPWLLAGIAALVLLTLGLAFRRWLDILLSVAMLAVSLLLLLAWMRLAGWQWNLMNLMAVPLLLGLGVDFSLHMILALRRHQGDLRAAHHAVGKALLLAGATTVAAFGSLAFSSNAGLASLGQVAAIGLICCQFTGIYLLPRWWQLTYHRHQSS